MVKVNPLLPLLYLPRVKEGLEQFDRERQKRRRVAFRRHFPHGLQVAQLQGDGVVFDDAGGFRELGGRLELALGVDDLGAPLALDLPGNSPLHLLRRWQFLLRLSFVDFFVINC